jgi:hypothetical protein
MTDTDLLQPDPGPLRAVAEAAELAQAVSGLVSIDGCRLADSDPLAPLARDIARSMTEAAQVGAVARDDLQSLTLNRYAVPAVDPPVRGWIG